MIAQGYHVSEGDISTRLYRETSRKSCYSGASGHHYTEAGVASVWTQNQYILAGHSFTEDGLFLMEDPRLHI